MVKERVRYVYKDWDVLLSFFSLFFLNEYYTLVAIHSNTLVF